MTEISSNRGTSKKTVDDKKSNWAGKEFKEYQDQRKEETQDESVSTGRGTSTEKVSELKSEECGCSHSGMKKSTKRGTDSEVID